jgi:hypothetical protein
MKTTTCLLALTFSLPVLPCATQGAAATTNDTRVHSWGAPADDLAALKDPKRFVKLLFREPNFEDLAKNFTETDLPAFFDILNDDYRPSREKSVAISIIQHLSQKGDDKIVAQLVDFLTRPVKWEIWTTNNQEQVRVVMAKASALRAVGIIGGSKAEGTLKQAITASGAQELAKAWISGWPASNRFGSAQDILDDLRGAAAERFARDKATWELVQTEFARERQACIESGQETRYFSNLVVAMAMIDAIKEVGTLPDPRFPSLIMQYRKKYQLTDAAPKTP